MFINSRLKAIYIIDHYLKESILQAENSGTVTGKSWYLSE